MPRLRAPGVYFEPGDPPARRIAEVRTDVAGFVGVAPRGPLHVPVRVENWTQFTTRFGGHTRDGFLAYAVKGFFANGGRTCWVVRVGAADPDVAAHASLLLLNATKQPVFEVQARDCGPGTQRLSVRVETATNGRFSLFVEEDGEGGAREVLEVWRDLDPVPDPTGTVEQPKNRYAPFVVNGHTVSGAERGQPDEAERSVLGSVLIKINDRQLDNIDRGTKLPLGVAPPGYSVLITRPQDKGGSSTAGPVRQGYLGAETPAAPVLDGLTLAHFTGEDQPPDRFWGLKALERVDEVSIVAVPDLVWQKDLRDEPRPPKPRCDLLPRGEPQPEPPASLADVRMPLSAADQGDGQVAILRHCAILRDRFAVLDAPVGLRPDTVINTVVPPLQSDAGQFGGLYYPWILVPDPLVGPDVRLVPPSGHVAGMFARVDLSVGVQKPPANEVLEEVRGVEFDTDATLHAWLNDAGVNAIRPYPARGVRVAGGRTLVQPKDPDMRQWRYVHVRRLLLMFEKAIDRATQWVVFADNRPERWQEIDRVVRTFLDDQWRRGRLDGATAEEAYEVTCDVSTNPAASVDAGRMICQLAVRPPFPAELVIVRLGRRVGETGAVAFGGPASA